MIALENLELVAFMIQHPKRCYIDYKLDDISWQMIRKIAGQKNLKDGYTKLETLLKVSKIVITTTTMDHFKEYHRKKLNIKKWPHCRHHVESR